MRTPLFALFSLTLLPFLNPTPAMQNPSGSTSHLAATSTDVDLVTRDQAQVFYYTPLYTDAYELHEVANTLYGNDIATLDGDGEIIDFTTNMLVIGGSRILIYDSREHADQILKLFADLDKPLKQPETEPKVELRADHYKPRYLTAFDVLDALGPFIHAVDSPNGPTVGNEVLNVRMLNQSGIIMMLDTQAHLNEMRAFLDQIDQPAPQVQLTCYVLRGTDQPVSNNLPKELTSNLSSLVPFTGFELASMGTVRTSAGSGNSVSIEMQGKDEQFTLDTRITAFDTAKSGAEVLTMSSCKVMHSYIDFVDPTDVNARAAGKTTQTRARQLFSTNASINGGEYAVMGATGTDPIFVVLRFSAAK